VALGPGRHNIHFQYQPVTFYCGLWVSLTTLLGIMLFFVRQRKKINRLPKTADNT
jgi:uncharacterized membrane protein YfhO